jgi:hypothetical protein
MDGSSEASLRRLWEQLSPATLLHTLDDRPLRIITTGTSNSDAGPDYLDALIRLDGRYYRGDVEIHLRQNDWRAHGHHIDPHYNRVILHVVGARAHSLCRTMTSGHREIPTVILVAGTGACISGDDQCGLSPAPGPCVLLCKGTSSSRAEIGPPAAHVLQKLGWSRIDRRVTNFALRLEELIREESLMGGASSCRSAAWDQLLYEGILEGMGYRKNKSSFLHLAQNIPLTLLRRWQLEDASTMSAVLFGAAGLLPPSRGLSEKMSREYVGRLRRRWRQLRPLVCRPLLHEADWLFFRLRPVNFPTARLATFVHLLPHLFQRESAETLLGRFRNGAASARNCAETLRRCFAFVADGFWSTHLHFRAPGPGPGIALGRDRIDAIIMNTLIPAALLHARLCGGRTTAAHARAMVRALRTPARNSCVRLVERNLRPTGLRIDSALLHQGALELHRRYCHPRCCAQCPLIG